MYACVCLQLISSVCVDLKQGSESKKRVNAKKVEHIVDSMLLFFNFETCLVNN